MSHHTLLQKQRFTLKHSEKMPKIETLDALGDAITTILTTTLTTHLQNMPRTFPRYPKFVSKLVRRNGAHPCPMTELCPRYVQDMTKIWPQYPQDLPKIYPIYAWDMPKIGQIYAQDMPKICLIYGQDMPKILSNLKKTWMTEWLTLHHGSRDASASN